VCCCCSLLPLPAGNDEALADWGYSQADVEAEERIDRDEAEMFVLLQDATRIAREEDLARIACGEPQLWGLVEDPAAQGEIEELRAVMQAQQQPAAGDGAEQQQQQQQQLAAGAEGAAAAEQRG
jgi:hypothetical protein